MSEVLRHIPESVANARPKEEQTAHKYSDAKAVMAAFWGRRRKARRQTWEDVQRSAEFRAGIDEAVEQFWKKEASRGVEGRPTLLGWLVMLLLGGIVALGDDIEEGEA